MGIRGISCVFFVCFSVNVSAGFVSDSNETQVDKIDLELLLESAPPKEQKKLLNNKAKLIRQLEQLYIKKVLAAEAVENGLDKDPMTAARLRTINENALFLLRINEVRLSDKRDYSKLAKQQYTVNKSDYKVGERIDAAHILITAKDRSEEKALEKIKGIRKELIAGANFSEVADRESDDGSVKHNHGELGLFTKGQLVKEFTDIAFSLKPGDLSEPVKTVFGYHLIKLNKKVPAGVKSFEEVKDLIVTNIKAKNWETARQEYIDKTKKDHQMKVDEKALEAFVVKKLEEVQYQ